ncbi:hypothetical protein HK098_005287 [Nowakowskiella sp. JEL0407]|nr:hypothetical protein HK098_005287 [Nowakowskiella sp. JEL0407]
MLSNDIESEPGQTVLSGAQLFGAQMAVDEINKDRTTLPDATLKLIEYYHEDQESAIKAVHKAIEDDVHLVIGNALNSMTKETARITSASKLPHVSILSDSHILDDRSAYGYFWRILGDGPLFGMSKLMEKFGWKRVVIIYENNEYQSSMMARLSKILMAQGIKITTTKSFTITPTYQSVRSDLRDTMLAIKNSKTKVVISLCTSYLGYFVLNEAARYGILGKDYFWMLGEPIDFSPELFELKSFKKKFKDYQPVADFPAVLKGVTYLQQESGFINNNDQTKNFLEDLRIASDEVGDRFLGTPLWEDVDDQKNFPSQQLLDAYDVVWAFAKTVDQVIDTPKLTAIDFVNKNLIGSFSLNTTAWNSVNFEGITGKLEINKEAGTKKSYNQNDGSWVYQYSGKSWSRPLSDKNWVWRNSAPGKVTQAGEVLLNLNEELDLLFDGQYIESFLWPSGIKNATDTKLLTSIPKYEIMTLSNTGVGILMQTIFGFAIVFYIVGIVQSFKRLRIGQSDGIYGIVVYVGLSMMFSEIYLETRKLTSRSCIMLETTQGLGFALAMSGILSKLFNLQPLTLDAIKPNISKTTSIITSTILLIELILLRIWSKSSKFVPSFFVDEESKKYSYFCTNPNNPENAEFWQLVVFLFNASIMIAGSVLAFYQSQRRFGLGLLSILILLTISRTTFTPFQIHSKFLFSKVILLGYGALCVWFINGNTCLGEFSNLPRFLSGGNTVDVSKGYSKGFGRNYESNRFLSTKFKFFGLGTGYEKFHDAVASLEHSAFKLDHKVSHITFSKHERKVHLFTLGNTATPPVLVVSLLSGKDLLSLKTSLELIKLTPADYHLLLVPILNPDGFVANSAKNTNPQQNQENCPNRETDLGVYLPTNFPYNFQSTNSAPCSETYPGKSPLSETESNALNNLILQKKPKMIVYLHDSKKDYSGVILPFKFSSSPDKILSSADFKVYRNLTDTLNKAYNSKINDGVGVQDEEYVLSSWKSYDNTLESGYIGDWTFEKLEIWSVEVHLNTKNSAQSESDLEAIAKLHAAPLTKLFELAPHLPAKTTKHNPTKPIHIITKTPIYLGFVLMISLFVFYLVAKYYLKYDKIWFRVSKFIESVQDLRWRGSYGRVNTSEGMELGRKIERTDLFGVDDDEDEEDEENQPERNVF